MLHGGRLETVFPARLWLDRPMRCRFALLVLLAVLLTACASNDPAGPAGSAPEPTAAPEPSAAPATTRARPAKPRPAPEGVVAADRREAAPDLLIAAFDGRTVTLGGFRGKPVVVNFFESW
jgi:hypothetical protein